MFCTKCGTKLDAEAKFCKGCGTAVSQSSSNTKEKTQDNSEVAIEAVAPPPLLTPDAFMPISTGTHQDTELLKTLIGKNSDYYLRQFEKIDRNEKSFNVCALLFAPIILLYRKQFSYFLKLLLPVYALLFIQVLLSGYATATFDLSLMAVIPFTGVITGIYAIVTAILCGKGFNKHYKTQLNNIITEKGATMYMSIEK